jgi:signal transduction histidine kinase
MDEINSTTDNKIFSSCWTLNYRNAKLEESYNNITYKPYTFRSYIPSIILLLIQLYNSIILYIKEEPRFFQPNAVDSYGTVRVLNLIVLGFTIGVLTYIIITRNKAVKFIKVFYLLIFNNFLYVLLSLRLTILMELGIHNPDTVIKDGNYFTITCLIVISVVFIGILILLWDSNNFIYFFISKVFYNIIVFVVGVVLTDIDTVNSLLLLVTLLSVFFIIVCHIIIKFIKKMYYFKMKLALKNKWLVNTLDNIQSGIIKIKDNKLVFANRNLLTNLRFLLKKKPEEGVFDQVNPKAYSGVPSNKSSRKEVNECIEHKLAIKRTFTGFTANDFNDLYVDCNILKNLEHKNELKIREELLNAMDELSFNEMLNEFSLENKKNGLFNKFQFLGMKSFKKTGEIGGEEQILEIHFKMVEKDNEKVSFEIIFNDVTRSNQIKEAEAKFKYKSLFLAKIAHEFKSPLIGMSELISQTREIEATNPSTGVLTHNLTMCNGLSSYMLMLVKDFEVISKGEDSTQINICRTTFNLEEEMSFICNIVNTLLKTRHQDKPKIPVKFNVDIANDIPANINTDKVRLTQILINIISNSVKFTNQGSIDLLIRLDEFAVSKLLVTVKDTGPGISKAEASELFKPYTKCAFKNNNYGSGLGLNIAKDLCKLLGGDLLFEHNEPTGCIFKFTLDVSNPIRKYSSLEGCQSSRIEEDAICINKIAAKKNSFYSLLSDNTLKTSQILNFPYDVYKPKLRKIKVNGFEDIEENVSLCIKEQNIYAQNININNYNNYRIQTNTNTFPLKYRIINYTTSGQDHVMIDEIDDFIENINKERQIVILIVDDDQLVRSCTLKAFMKFFASAKIQTNVLFIEASDGLECLYGIYKAGLYNIKIDLIVTDETMKYMSGSEWIGILDEMVRNAIFAKIPVYVLTGYDVNDMAVKEKFDFNIVSGIYVKPLYSDHIERMLKDIKFFD